MDGVMQHPAANPLAGPVVMQLQLLACTIGVLLWAALPTAMASAADLLKAGDAAYSSGNYNRCVVQVGVYGTLVSLRFALLQWSFRSTQQDNDCRVQQSPASSTTVQHPELRDGWHTTVHHHPMQPQHAVGYCESAVCPVPTGKVERISGPPCSSVLSSAQRWVGRVVPRA